MPIPEVVTVGELVAGKYRLERELGAGGMGVVFAAVHVHLDQRVALKFLAREAAGNPELVERFWREARAAVKIQSQHVARVMDIGQLGDGTPYIVMEYLDGEDLEAHLARSGPLAVDDAVRYVLQACEALAEVHTQGMVHRDLKPGNLFLAARPDGSAIVKLLDFGISKAPPAWADASRVSLTNTSAVVGSPRYMAPEQLRSARDVDARADLWGLGVTLFELVTNESPFADGSMPEVCASILKDEPRPLAALRPTAPDGLDAVIRRCLAKDPDQRYRDVAELALALRPFGRHGVIDISIERIVGTIQIAMSAAPEPTTETPTQPIKVPEERKTSGSAPHRSASQARPQLSEHELEHTYLGKLGGRTQGLRLAMPAAQITRLSLDHRAGFLLSLIGETSTVDELLLLSGMPRVETLRLACELLDLGVLALTD